MKKKRLDQMSTYVPKRKIVSVKTKKAVIDSDQLLDGVYVRGKKKLAKGGKAASTMTAKQVAKKLMKIDSDVWNKLDVDSGSQLYSDPELQKKYIAELDKSEANHLMAASKNKQKVFDELEDWNHHAMCSYIVGKGHLGDEAMQRAKMNYDFTMREYGKAYTLNPEFITRVMAEGGRVFVGKFNEEQLRNKEDKLAIEKKMKETGLKYVDSKIIMKNGKPNMMEVYLYADGGMMAEGGNVSIPMRMPTLEEKVEDIVGSPSWHSLDADEKASLVQLMVADGDVKVSLSHGGYMREEEIDWGMYEPSMRKSDNKYVVYSRSHGVMSFNTEEEAKDYIKQVKKDLVELTQELDKDVMYAKGGVTEAVKYKVVYQMKGMDAPKEKMFDDKGKAETFVEMMSDDEDVSKIKMEEVKEKVKKTTTKAAEAVAPPVSLFGMAKGAPKASPTKKEKPQVQIPGIADDIKRYDELHAIIKNAEAEKEVLHGTLRQVGIDKFMELYERRGSRPDNFELADGDQAILFMVKDQYEKVTPEKAGILEAYPDLLETEVKYSFDPATLERVGDVVSRLIMDSKLLSDEDKRNLLVVETKQFVKKGTIDRLLNYDDPRMIFDIVKPQTGLK